ncbi:MAG: hypothetical protein WCP20_22295 [Desulfuromonadales bacterium]
MQAQRFIYEHAPPTIPIPAEFQNRTLEVLFLQLNELETRQTTLKVNSQEQLKQLLASSPAKLNAISIDTTGFRFDRDEANAR